MIEHYKREFAHISAQIDEALVAQSQSDASANGKLDNPCAPPAQEIDEMRQELQEQKGNRWGGIDEGECPPVTVGAPRTEGDLLVRDVWIRGRPWKAYDYGEHLTVNEELIECMQARGEAAIRRRPRRLCLEKNHMNCTRFQRPRNLSVKQRNF